MKTIIVDGIEYEVKVCKPSRRKAASSIQRPRYQKGGRGAKWLAKDKEEDNL